MNNLPRDILRVIVDKLDVSDAANLALSIGDTTLLEELKCVEYKILFEKKMKNLWFGRMIVFFKMWRSRQFWDSDSPDIFTIDRVFRGIRHGIDNYVFQDWDAARNGNKLHLMTKVLNDTIVIVIDLGFPARCCSSEAKIGCSFDIIYSSHPIDIDSYAPKNSPLIYINDAYRSQLEQVGHMGNHGNVVWDKIVTMDDTIAIFESKIGPEWSKLHNLIYTGIVDDVKITVEILGSIIMSSGPISGKEIYGESHEKIKDKIITSWGYEKRNSFDNYVIRKVAKMAISMELPINLHHAQRINVKLHGKTDTFYSWKELIMKSGISRAKLRAMSKTRSYREYFIDFDAHTYKRKPISFEL